MVGKGPGCESAPLLAPGYVLCNLGFNISLLNLLRASSSVIQSLTLSSLVRLTLYPHPKPFHLTWWTSQPPPTPPFFECVTLGHPVSHPPA